MKKIICALVVLLSLQSFAQKESILNDPNAQRRTLDGTFTTISVTDGVELFLIQGNEESIAISASDDKYLERYKTEVSNGILKIYYDNKGVNWTGNEKRRLKAYVSFKQLEKLNASGGAQVKMQQKLISDKMECTFTSGSSFNGEVEMNDLDIAQNSGASFNITGKAGKLTVDVSSGAIFKGYELLTDFCDAKASSGGGIRINVNKELTVKANSGGGIRYKGNGVIKEMNVNSGGNVKKG